MGITHRGCHCSTSQNFNQHSSSTSSTSHLLPSPSASTFSVPGRLPHSMTQACNVEGSEFRLTMLFSGCSCNTCLFTIKSAQKSPKRCSNELPMWKTYFLSQMCNHSIHSSQRPAPITSARMIPLLAVVPWHEELKQPSWQPWWKYSLLGTKMFRTWSFWNGKHKFPKRIIRSERK